MNLVVVFPKSRSFLRLVGRMLGRVSKVPAARPRRRYVNIGEFSPHLQRDMGFMDGHDVPRSGCGRDARDVATRDWMR